MAGRPRAEFDKKQFADLIGLGCGDQEICWWFRDADGKPANIDTLSRWCKREFGMNFQEFRKKNGGIARNIQIRKNQLDLSKNVGGDGDFPRKAISRTIRRRRNVNGRFSPG
jgi:hypothetical protein